MNQRLNLVTGGAGFIGRHLVDQLLAAGERVRVFDLLADPPLPRRVDLRIGSVADPVAVRGAMAGVDRVFHLAGNPDLWAVDKRVFDRTNHCGTRVMLAEAARTGVQRFVHCSTESILAGGSRGAMIDESAAPTLADMRGPYCRSKFLAEEAARQAVQRGEPVVIVNPTLPVGPGDHRLTPPTRMLLLFLNGRSPAYLDCSLNLADVRDIARGHLLAAERGRIGERYILGGYNLRLGELLETLHRVTGIAMPRRSIPYPLALVVGAVAEFIADRITRCPPVAPLTGVRLAATAEPFDCRKAATELGFTVRPIEKSLAEATVWLADRRLVLAIARRRPALPKTT